MVDVFGLVKPAGHGGVYDRLADARKERAKFAFPRSILIFKLVPVTALRDARKGKGRKKK
jgi:hypothetical protein